MADIPVLEQLKSLLEPFKEATITMSTESSSSVSLIRPLLHSLINICKPDPQLNDVPVIHQAKAVMYHDLEKR